MQANPDDNDGAWNYDPTVEADDTENANNDHEDEESNEDEDCYYYGYGCLVNVETARRVTHVALAVETPIWMLGDGAFDMLEWHDNLVEEGIVPVAPYNPGNTDNPLDIRYRSEDRIENYTNDARLKQSVLRETYNRRTQVERTIGANKDCGPGRVASRGRVHVKTHVGLHSASAGDCYR